MVSFMPGIGIACYVPSPARFLALLQDGQKHEMYWRLAPARQIFEQHQHELDMTRLALRMIGIEPREPDAEFYVGRGHFEKAAAAHGVAA